MYAKQNMIHLNAPLKRSEQRAVRQVDPQCRDHHFKPAMSQVSNSVLPTIHPEQKQQTTGSASSSRSSSAEPNRPIAVVEQSLSMARVDLGSRSSLVESPHHGTPRSVKYRNKVNK
ncbi:unnamed protein product [Anisakis simplex]|uniref:Uncharacterized protein n=1 Tax=Anisakis simplex TaxID=6269 RepID=A0A0M3K9Q5_ANISI|nr:unnamed protein product [Anisakis simplex]